MKFLNGGTLLYGSFNLALKGLERNFSVMYWCNQSNSKMTTTTHWLIPVKSTCSILISVIHLKCIILIWALSTVLWAPGKTYLNLKIRQKIVLSGIHVLYKTFNTLCGCHFWVGPKRSVRLPE